MPQPPGPDAARVTVPGQDRSVWASRVSGSDLRSLADLLATVPGRDHLLVLSAHPDDETIGAGRLLSAWWRTRGATYAVLATAGEACVDHVGPRPAGLGARRVVEWRSALGELGVEPLATLGLADGRLEASEDALVAGVLELFEDEYADADRVVLLAPHPLDPHPDHRAIGRAAARVAAELDLPLWSFPVWLTYWAEPSAALGGELVRVGLDELDARARDAALGWFTSQTEPLAPGWDPVVPPAMLSHHDDQLLVLPDGSVR